MTDIYIVFKHVWTESDTGGKEYEFVKLFLALDDARKFVSEEDMIRTSWYYGDLVINHILYDPNNRNIKQTDELFWKEEFGAWINKGAFKSVSEKEIQMGLELYRI